MEQTQHMSDSNSMSSIYEFSHDLSNAEAPPALPIAEYRATVQAVAAQVSKNSGNRMGVFTYLITPDQYPADFTEGSPDGETSNVYVVMKDDARTRFRLRKFCEMHGVTPSRSLNLPDFIGQEVIVKCEHEEYQGETRVRLTPVRQV